MNFTVRTAEAANHPLEVESGRDPTAQTPNRRPEDLNLTLKSASAQELSIADRNIICSREGEELSELLAWTKGFVDSGMDRVRAAVSTVHERSNKCEAIHNRLVGTLRQATMAPYRGVDEPKKLLRSVIAGL
jgi:hypothetical protein